MALRELLLEMTLLLVAIGFFLLGHGIPGVAPTDFEPPQRSDDIYRAVTWNVGGPQGEFGHPLQEEDIEHVANVLLELSPDICFLQEVEGRSQVRELVRALGSGWVSETTRQGGDRCIAILASRGRLRRFVLPGTEGRVLGVIHRESDRPSVAAACVHASAFEAEERNLTLGSVVERLLQFTEIPHQILAGDLNLDLDVGKRGDLFTNNQHRDIETYNYIAARFQDAGIGKGATAEPDRRLDYIFFKEGAFEVEAAGPWKKKRSPRMDHSPLIGDFSLLR